MNSNAIGVRVCSGKSNLGGINMNPKPICKYCGQEKDGNSCAARNVKFPDGSSLRSVKYLREVFAFEYWLHSVFDAPETFDDKFMKEVVELYRLYARATCEKCGCRNGGYHHRGCEYELCPYCMHELISCGCLEG